MQRVKLSPLILMRSPMDFRWVDFNYLQYKVQSLKITSVRQYWKWQKEYSPRGFPLRPDRIYDISWNEIFNGINSHSYGINRKPVIYNADLVPFEEAVRHVQSLQLSTRKEYHRAYEDGKIQKNIPKYVEIRYKMFYQEGGWINFLGTDIKHRLKAAESVSTLLLLYRTVGRSSNILSMLIHKTGMIKLRELLSKKRNIEVVKVYVWETKFSESIYNLLNSYGSKQDEVSWMFSNVNAILFELGGYLEESKI